MRCRRLLVQDRAGWRVLFMLLGGLLVISPLWAQPRSPIPEPALRAEIGLDAVLGQRAFEAGFQAFESGEYRLARRHWAPAARRGHARSQFYLGLLYESRPDHSRAAFWFRQAARRGLPEAQHKLALAYARGEGVPRNMPRALRWWLRAARQGNADSQYNLGVIYTLGEDGIARDMRRAAHWWRRAAQGGDAMAQYNLGTIYANGDTGRPNPCQALHWWRKSRQNGFDQAAVALRSLLGQNAARQCKTQADGGALPESF